MITAEQMRAARAMLRMDQARLAERSGISLPTIKRLEGGAGPLAGRATTVWRIEQAFEAAGIEFIDPNGGGPGVRLLGDDGG